MWGKMKNFDVTAVHAHNAVFKGFKQSISGLSA
jgi:hypothetical protein